LLFPVPKEKIYVVEADCDRPQEGKILAQLLKPDVTVLLNLARTHTVNFDKLVQKGRFFRVEEAIAHEFGYFLAQTKQLAIVNGDSTLITDQVKRTRAKVLQLNNRNLKGYEVSLKGTKFVLRGQ